MEKVDLEDFLKIATWNIVEHLGTSWNILEHLGTSSNILEHLGALLLDHVGSCWIMIILESTTEKAVVQCLGSLGILISPAFGQLNIKFGNRGTGL